MELRELLKRLDIVDVISSYIDLQRTGNNYRARCPFHPDDTPSLYVSPSKGIWKCFGCGVGGDAVKFVALYENISYTEALLELAKKYKLPVKVKLKKKDDNVLIALRMVAEYYHNNLKESLQALEYLKNRGIQERTIKKFQLGYSPSSEQLVSFLREKQILEIYEKTGNITKIDEKHYKDLLAGRLIIPIRDIKGNVVGFGGRSLKENSPKYINSPETEFFKKRETLYGFYEGLSYIREKRRVIIVEGYFDVMSMHQEGFPETVAPMGTSLGPDHAKIISAYAEEVILMFDGDEAGRKAIKQTAPHLLREGLKVKVFLLPEGEDPDTFVKKQKKELQNALKEAKDIFSWLLAKKDSKAIEDYLYFCGFVKDKLHQIDLLTTLSKKTNIPVSVLADKLPKHQEKPKEQAKEKLSFHERVFLFGLYNGLGNKEDLYKLNLSPYAMELAEAILREDYHLVPEEIKNQSLYNLERAFEESLKHLMIKGKVEEKTSLQEIRQRKTTVRLRGIKEDL